MMRTDAEHEEVIEAFTKAYQLANQDETTLNLT